MTAATRSLQWLAQAAAGQWLVPPAAQATFIGATTDSRNVASNTAFIALKGERVDGFDFCAQAAAAGAAVLVVSAGRGVPKGATGVPVLAVDDPLTALGRMAETLRAEFTGRVVAVTGSNGKTTTKELIAAALSSAGEVLKTPGNFNTDVGLPLTLLGATGNERFWVLEMAMRGRGEISYLTHLAQPHVAVVTNIGAAHLGRLGSLQAIAEAKGEIFEGLVDDGVALVPDGEPLLAPSVQYLPKARVKRFGTRVGDGPGLAVSILDCVPAGAAGSVVRYAVGDEPVLVNLPLSGLHNAVNGCIALTVASNLGIAAKDAAAGLERVQLPPHRSRPLALGDRVVLDDCYNANPSSMKAGVAAAVAGARGTGRAFAVLGDMLELGDDETAMHEQVGRDAVQAGVAGVVGVGDLGRHIARGARAQGLAADFVVEAADPAEAARQVAQWSRGGDWILVKGSRGARLERVVAALQTIWAEESKEDQPES
ncbi:MAG: UDP-N-acetylmuramoyl-tripeptide--D-alanyl-D-alanine ligase [Deltaproteobacteria bacterium]|nr:UDP-N-acetylmuramoyl-tripeptide--D-alanyl-D-alanine ligase [Deltaproteobacteria bacterium]